MSTTEENNNAEPIMEQDFDDKPTELYTCIGDGNWERAAEVAMENPDQVKTWVVRYHKKDEGSDKADRKVMLPLHYACGNHSSYSVINMLLIAHPQGAEERDVYGKLPIHHACQWGASSPWVVGMLLTVYPESVFELDNNEHTPLDLAKAGKYDDKASIIATLARCASAAAIRAESAAVRAETLERNAEDIETLEKELEVLKNEKVDLSSALDTHRVTSKKAMDDDTEQLKVLEADLVKAQTEYDNIKRELDDTYEDRTSTKLEANRLSEKCDVMRSELEEVQKERDDLREKVLREINKSREVIDRLEEEVSEGVTEMKSLCARESSLISEIEDAKREKANIRQLQQTFAMEVEGLEKYRKKAEAGRKVLEDFSSAVEPLSEKQKTLVTATDDHVDKIKKINVKRDRQLLEIALSEETRRFDTVEHYKDLQESMENQEKGLMVIVEAIKACGVVEGEVAGKNFSPEQPME